MKSAQLGNVVFRPSVDGLIRGMSVVVPWKGGDVPAMSALLAGPAAFTQGGFLLDQLVSTGSRKCNGSLPFREPD